MPTEVLKTHPKATCQLMDMCMKRCEQTEEEDQQVIWGTRTAYMMQGRELHM